MLFSPSQQKVNKFEGGTRISYYIQYAVQAIVHIKDTGKYALQAKSKSVFYDKALNELQYGINIKNTGTLALRPRVCIDIYNEHGIKVLHKNPFERWTFPEKENNYTVSINELPVGKYRGLMVFDQKGCTYFAAKLSFEVTYSDNIQRIRLNTSQHLRPENLMRNSLNMPTVNDLLESRANERAEKKEEEDFSKEGNFFKIFEDSISKLFKFKKFAASD